MKFQIINSDVFAGLNSLDNNSIDCAVTSPPYWDQRDYGFEGQIGNETSYIKYISKSVKIYNLLRKKLNDKGVFFLNIGDKYLDKYGKTPLGLIPYKLAYFMKLDGWCLNDILIWYKPNHMPSSIKNRFNTTYEPVFVLSKNEKNYYTEYIDNNYEHSKILKVNVQQLKYKHVASYPEKLIEKLILMLNIPSNGTILDPFTGSGTTGKAVINLNQDIILNKNLSCIMIEKSEDYVEIIKERCELNKNQVKKYNYVEYNIEELFEKDFYSDREFQLIKTDDKRGFINIVDNSIEYNKLLNAMLYDKKKY